MTVEARRGCQLELELKAAEGPRTLTLGLCMYPCYLTSPGFVVSSDLSCCKFILSMK